MPKCCRSKQGMCCRSKELYAEKGQRGVVCRNVVDQSKRCVVDQRSCMPKKGREELYAEMLSIKARDVLSIKGFVCRKRAERSCMPKKGHKSTKVVVLE